MVGPSTRACGCTAARVERVICVGCWPKAKVGARTAPTTAIAIRSERKIVILVIQRSGKVLEVVAGGAGGALRALRCTTARHSGACTAFRIAATAATEHDELAHVDLRRIPRLPVLVLPLTVLDAPFDVDLVTLLDVLLDDVGQLRTLGIPNDAAMPLRLFLTVALRGIPRAARRQREAGDAVSAVRRSNLGIRAEISDQGDLVQASAHDSSWRVRECSPRKVGVRADTTETNSVRVWQFGCGVELALEGGSHSAP